MNLYEVDFINEGQWFTYDIRATDRLHAACELMRCARGSIITGMVLIECAH